MSLSSSNNANRRKNYTQTHLQRPKKSSTSSSSKQKKIKEMRQRMITPTPPTKMMFLSTSARKDPTLARNKLQRTGVSDDDRRTDFGTSRNNLEATSRDRADDDDHPHVVTIGEEKPEEDEDEVFVVANIVDKIGDAVVDANDALVKMIFDNEEVTKFIFPVEGYPPNKDNVSENDYSEDIPQATSVDYFMNVNQTTFDGSPVEMTTSIYEDTKSNAVFGQKSATKKKSGGMKLLMTRRKRSKTNGRNGPGSAQVLDAIVEDRELSGVDGTQESGIEQELGNAGNAEREVLVHESMALLSIYDKSQEEDGRVGGGAFALCGDDNTIITSDQRELTLQEYSDGAKKSQLQPIQSKAAGLSTAKKNTEEQKKQLRARKLALVKEKALDTKKAPLDTKKAPFLLVQESKSKEASCSKPTLEDDNSIVTSLQQEWTLDDYSGKKKKVHAEPILDDNTILTSENQEFTLEDFSGARSISSKSCKKKLLDVNAILCQNTEFILDDNYQENAGSVPSEASSKSSASTVSTDNTSLKEEDGSISKQSVNPTVVTDKSSLKGEKNGPISKKSANSIKSGKKEEEEAIEHANVDVPNLHGLTMTSFDLPQNEDLISTISMETGLRSDARSSHGGNSLLRALARYTRVDEESEEGEDSFIEETIIGETFTEESDLDGARWLCLGL